MTKVVLSWDKWGDKWEGFFFFFFLPKWHTSIHFSTPENFFQLSEGSSQLLTSPWTRGDPVPWHNRLSHPSPARTPPWVRVQKECRHRLVRYNAGINNTTSWFQSCCVTTMAKSPKTFCWPTEVMFRATYFSSTTPERSPSQQQKKAMKFCHWLPSDACC